MTDGLQCSDGDNPFGFSAWDRFFYFRSFSEDFSGGRGATGARRRRDRHAPTGAAHKPNSHSSTIKYTCTRLYEI